MTTMSEPSFWILTSLTAEPRHGYGILRDVEGLSGGTISLRVTTLYAGLERLERSGLIRVSGEEIVEGRARRYFELTSDGRNALSEEAERLRVRGRVASAGLAGRNPASGLSLAGT